MPVYHQNFRRVTSPFTLIQPKKSRVDRGDGSFAGGEGGCCFEADSFVEGVVDVEADLFKIEPQQIDLHRIGAEFVLDLCVLDAGVELRESLGIGFNAEAAKDAEEENQKWKLSEYSAVETFLLHNQAVINSRSCHLLTQAVLPSVAIY